MICPVCDAALSNKAKHCVCGWRKVTPAPAKTPAIACAFAACTAPALLRRKTPTGWANLCEKHDVELVQKDADEWMKSMGLERQGETSRAWRERTVAWLKANGEKRERRQGFKSPADIVVAREREPGDDDEEVAA